MTTADDLAAVVASLRSVAADLALPDAYTISRPTDIEDGAGGFTQSLTTVEAGKCRQRTGGIGRGEQLVFERLEWTTGYAIDLLLDTTLVPSDNLVVNGTTFDVGDIQRTGEFAIFATALVRERS